MHKDKIITIFGGSGFLGSVVAQRLLRCGYRVRVAVRYPDRAGDVLTGGDVGQVAAIPCDIKSDADVAAAVDGAYGVVNCVGILYPSGKQKFATVQAQAAGRIAQLANRAGVQRLVHVSAIGADEGSKSRYGASKGLGEALVRGTFDGSVILRPSIIFGRGDSFFNRFAKMSQGIFPVPLVGEFVKMQPVYVGDVAEAVVVGLEDSSCAGRVYELGGEDVATFKALLDLIGEYTGREMRYVRIPIWAAKIMGVFAGLLPKPPITRDQVIMLEQDNVVAEGALGLADLGIEPTSLHAILPTYMDIYTETGQYSKYREV